MMLRAFYFAELIKGAAMARKLLAGLAMLAIVGAVWVLQPVEAQDDADGRTGALETRVAILETQTSTQAPTFTTSPLGESGIATPIAGNPLTVVGVGSLVTDDFRLPTGRYVVTVQWATGCCITVRLFGFAVEGELILSAISDNGGRKELLYTADRVVPGGVFLEVGDTDAAWQVTFEPR